MDSFGIDGIKHFIVQDDKKAVGKVLKRIELANRKDNKITLKKLNFSMNGYYNLTANEIDKLSETAQDFFQQSIVSMKMKNQQTLSMLGCSKIPCKKKKNIVTCGIFQIYFYKKFFFPAITVQSRTTKN